MESENKKLYCHASLKSSGGEYKSIRLHRWITDCPDDMQVDHFNHKTLDNTDENLRIVTGSENKQNSKGARSDSGSRIRNVYWSEVQRKWRVRIWINGKGKHIGYYKTISEAKKEAEKARARYFPFSKEASA